MLATTAARLAAVLGVAPLRALFHFELPSAMLLAAAAGLALAVLALLEGLRWALRSPGAKHAKRAAATSSAH